MSVDTSGVDEVLSFDQTWSKRKAHRRSVAEVFITDAIRLDPTHVRLAAQTPACHLMFGDHTPTPEKIDPLLLAEICRQAGLITAYELGVPDSTTLATSAWDLRLDRHNVVPWGEVSDLEIEADFEWIRKRQGVARSGRCRQRVFHAGAQVAELNATSTFVTPGQVAALRLLQRGDAPPWSDSMPVRQPESLASPSDVGRGLGLNVVLAGLSVEASHGSALLAPPFQNRALFDHSYDHVPMQVLGEAAVQLTTAITSGSEGFGSSGLSRVEGRFLRFIELDHPTMVLATLEKTRTGFSSAVVIQQLGETCVEYSLDYERGGP